MFARGGRPGAQVPGAFQARWIRQIQTHWNDWKSLSVLPRMKLPFYQLFLLKFIHPWGYLGLLFHYWIHS
jgi:hypothetical protein